MTLDELDQDAVQFGHEPLAITPDGRGIARWWVSMNVPSEGTVEEDGGSFSSRRDRRVDERGRSRRSEHRAVARDP